MWLKKEDFHLEGVKEKSECNSARQQPWQRYQCLTRIVYVHKNYNYCWYCYLHYLAKTVSTTAINTLLTMWPNLLALPAVLLVESIIAISSLTQI